MAWTWTAKRKSALEHLIRSKGNVRIAAEASQASAVPVSEAYIRDLKYRDENKPFRDEYRRRTGRILDALEVDTDYIVGGFVELTEQGKGHIKLGALKALGDWRGIWAPTKTQLTTESELNINLKWDDGDADDNATETA